MILVEKLAAFDLDGTLWDANSHYEILKAYFKTHFYESLVFRTFRHFFKNQAYHHICKKYEKIPKDYALSFELPFNEHRLALLKSKQLEGFACVIVTNAPYEIAFHASERLSVPFIKAPIGQKKSALDEQYSYKELFVCTDNIEDLDLLNAADSKKIVFTKNNRAFFERHGFLEQ
mgnify:CR=1 FL=1